MTTCGNAPSQRLIYNALDESEMTPTHWKIWLLSAMGIFLDGYDLFIIGIALPLVQDQWHTDPIIQGAVTSAALMGAIFGAMIGGRLTDKFGRKSIYTIDLMIFIVFTVLSAFAWEPISLIFFRFMLGVGIGADYPICASYVSEFMPAKKRGKMMIGAFSFQAIGMISAALVGMGILAFMPDLVDWRLMLISGVVPAVFILLWRTKVPESPRWLVSHGQTERAAEIVEKLVPESEGNLIEYELEEDEEEGVVPPDPPEPEEEVDNLKKLFTSKFRKRTAFVTIPWFTMDIATYAMGIFTPIIIGQLIIHGETNIFANDFLEAEGAAGLNIFLIAGFLLNIYLVDKWGRVPLQCLGLVGMISGLLLLATVGNESGVMYLVVGGYGVFNLLMNMGPNATTFMLPAEVFPTEMRASAHGFASSVAKMGAALGTMIFPVLQDSVGLSTTLIIIAAVCVVGLVATIVLRIETMGRSLEDISGGQDDQGRGREIDIHTSDSESA
jgi:MFS family permease